MLRCQKRQTIKVRIGIIFSGTAAAGNAGRGGWGASDQVGLMFAQMALLNITATAVSCYAQEEEKKEIAENFFSCGPITGCKAEDVPIITKGLAAIIISITVVVVAIPEGLPLSVTISLSFS